MADTGTVAYAQTRKYLLTRPFCNETTNTAHSCRIHVSAGVLILAAQLSNQYYTSKNPATPPHFLELKLTDKPQSLLG